MAKFWSIDFVSLLQQEVTATESLNTGVLQ